MKGIGRRENVTGNRKVVHVISMHSPPGHDLVPKGPKIRRRESLEGTVSEGGGVKMMDRTPTHVG